MLSEVRRHARAIRREQANIRRMERVLGLAARKYGTLPFGSPLWRFGRWVARWARQRQERSREAIRRHHAAISDALLPPIEE